MTKRPLVGAACHIQIGPLGYPHTWVKAISGGIDARFNPLRSYVDMIIIIGYRLESNGARDVLKAMRRICSCPAKSTIVVISNIINHLTGMRRKGSGRSYVPK